MQYLLTDEQIKQVDEWTIHHVGIPAMVLMERAAMAVCSRVIDRITKKDRILVLSGMGNNGADGIAVARILKESGYKVSLWPIGNREKATPEWTEQYKIAQVLDVNIINNVAVNEYTVIVDALFGVGLQREITGEYKDVIDKVNASNALVFSIDVPSGVDAARGRVHGVAIKAHITVTFGYQKLGLVLYPGTEFAGKVIVEDIGFPKKAVDVIKPDTFSYNISDLENLPVRKNRSNKGTYGKVLIIAGSRNMAGACFLSAKAAYRMGAGLIKILTVEENREIIQGMLPEAILTTYQPALLKNKIEVDRIINEIAWATTIVIGPGMGVNQSSEHLLQIVLREAKIPVVVDADAINLLAGWQSDTIDLPDNIILTPHLKEMAGLLHCSTETVKENLYDIAKSATKERGFVLALKDARTLVTNGVKVYVNQSGNHGMATGGSGDVLTGIIAAMAAAGLSPFEAACLGVYIHGVAGDEARKVRGTYSMMASDIVEALSKIEHLMEEGLINE